MAARTGDLQTKRDRGLPPSSGYGRQLTEETRGSRQRQLQPTLGAPGARRGTSVQANVAGCRRY